MEWGDLMLQSAGPTPPSIGELLEPRERLFWWDRPKHGLILRSQDLLLVPFFLVWAGGALTIFSKAFSQGQNVNPLFVLVALVFSVVGIYALVGRFIQDGWRRSRLIYGVTNQRILIISPDQVHSIELKNLGELEYRRSRGDRGSISFGPNPGLFGSRDFASLSGRPVVPTFEFIRDHDKVYSLIRNLTKSAGE